MVCLMEMRGAKRYGAGGFSWSCFFSLYGCCDRTRVLGAFLRELALGPLMTFDRFDLSVLLQVVRRLVRSVMAVPRSLNALRGQLLMIFRSLSFPSF